MPNRIYVIEERCVGCGKCVPACPVGPECLYMIDKQHGRWKKLAVINEEKCIFCNACVNVCDELFVKTKEKTGAENMFKAIVMEKEEVKPLETVDLSLYKDVWVFTEVRRGVIVDSGIELLSIGRKLADDLSEKLCAVLIGYNVKKYASELIHYGADVVYVIDDKIFENFLDEPFTYALGELINRFKPNKLLFPATSIGRSFSSRVAAKVKTGLTADATELAIDKNTRMLHATRPSFGGNLMATILCEKHRPEMASVRPHTFKKPLKDETRKGEVIEFEPDMSKCKIDSEFIDYIPEEKGEIDITQAEIIVSGGRGIGGAEGFKLLKELADLLGGAVGASRAAVDSGWIPYKHQVGLTGRTVHPRIYFAFGISGQVQHLAGMSSSDIIIAINKDKEAPLMKIANFAIASDWKEFCIALINKLKGK